MAKTMTGMSLFIPEKDMKLLVRAIYKWRKDKLPVSGSGCVFDSYYISDIKKMSIIDANVPYEPKLLARHNIRSCHEKTQEHNTSSNSQ